MTTNLIQALGFPPKSAVTYFVREEDGTYIQETQENVWCKDLRAGLHFYISLTVTTATTPMQGLSRTVSEFKVREGHIAHNKKETTPSNVGKNSEYRLPCSFHGILHRAAHENLKDCSVDDERGAFQVLCMCLLFRGLTFHSVMNCSTI